MSSANSLVKLAKYGLNYLQAVNVAIGRTVGVIDYPVPPNSIMRKTSTRKVRKFYEGGITTTSPIMTAALANGIELRQKNVRILDFGCGGGRQLVHFTKRFPDPSYFACDIDDTCVDFVRKAFPQVESHVSAFTPPLKYETGFFDLVYAVSIFSHLSKEDESRWLPEMARIIKPGGLFVPTIMGRVGGQFAAQYLGLDERELIAGLERDGIFYRELDDLKESVAKQETLKAASSGVGVTGTYGHTIISRDYVRRHWDNDQFELIEFAEGIIDFLQDMVVLRRRES